MPILSRRAWRRGAISDSHCANAAGVGRTKCAVAARESDDAALRPTERHQSVTCRFRAELLKRRSLPQLQRLYYQVTLTPLSAPK